jgi:hypothetical protein
MRIVAVDRDSTHIERKMGRSIKMIALKRNNFKGMYRLALVDVGEFVQP